MKTVRRVASDDLRADEVAALRDLFEAAWRNKGSEFSEEDLSGVPATSGEAEELVADHRQISFNTRNTASPMSADCEPYHDRR